MPIIKKILKIIGIILAIFLFLFILLTIWVYYHDKNQPEPATPTVNVFEQALTDPQLLYASSFWSGMCLSSVTKEEGGCSSQTYLYDSGEYVFTSHWQGINKKRVDSNTEKNLDKKTVDKIIKVIHDSQIMGKECPEYQTVDAGWDYQVQIDGQKKRFINRPAECQPTLDEIDKIITEAAKTAPTSTPKISATCTRCKVVFISKGTLPSPKQLITTISIYQDVADSFQSEYKFEDGSKVISQEQQPINKAKFDQLVFDALKVNPNANYDALPGCTGGSTYNLLVYDDERLILDTGNYRCAGKGTNPSMDHLSGEMLNLFAHLE